MNEDNRKSLIAAAPKLFGENFYFECDDGWHLLLFVAARQLEALDQDLKASQVKEKFGTLRFYLDTYTEEAIEIIREAEEKSAVTCEGCGEAGKLREGSWLRTLCEECYE